MQANGDKKTQRQPEFKSFDNFIDITLILLF